MSGAVTAPRQLLDGYLPAWHFREVHHRRIEAAPGDVMEALATLTPRQVPLSSALLAMRLVPAAVARRRWPVSPHRPWTEILEELGFVELERTPDEVVLGAIGRFWRVREELVAVADAGEFRRFGDPGFAKAAVNFRVDPQGDAVILSTETRVWAADPRARRRFLPYWVPVRLVGGVMRRELLASVAARAAEAAERTSIS